MSTEVLTHLFEPSLRVVAMDAERAWDFPSLIVLCKTMQAKLSAFSDGPGMGSKFVLTLPLEIAIPQTHEILKAAA